MDYKVIYFYSQGDKVYYIDENSNTLQTTTLSELKNPENKYHHFHAFEDYYKTHEDLIKFKNEFNILVDQIKSVKLKTVNGKLYSLNYKKFYNHNNAVLNVFLSRNQTGLMSSFEDITQQEFYIFERCLNSGLITLNLDYKNKPTECYGYDFSRYYTNLLNSMRIPTKTGKIYKLDDVKWGKLEFGIYRVKITYDNEKFTNIFNFSKLNHYTSSTLNHLYKIRNDYGLKFELLKDDQYNYNALIYDEKCLIKGQKIFSEWLKSLTIIKEKFPNNRIVKHLMSSLWGTLCSYNKEYTHNLEDYDATYMNNKEETEYKILDHLEDDAYIIINTSNAYKYPLARIKPFLTAYGRLKIMKFIESEKLEDNIIRIHTDGIILNTEKDFTHLAYHPKPENKTTGYMNFHNAVYGFHVCKKCNGEYRYKDFICHSC